MSPTMQLAPSASYAPTSDILDHHEYGVTKNRKQASTGGGRAWSDDEEVYLLQTRLQKMPYKHIAAHLKKTELACRLHYHQLSHGSNRRKRTMSVISGSSAGGYSPIISESAPSPIHEHSPMPSPPTNDDAYGLVAGGGVQLPSIMAATANTTSSPRLPTILPKPVSMSLALVAGASTTAHICKPVELPDSMASVSQPHSAPLLPALSFGTPASTSGKASLRCATVTSGAPSLRLDCSSLPPPLPSSAGPHQLVDMARLQSIYSVHQSHFWSAVASDYGQGASPAVLEQVWRSGGYGGTSSRQAPNQQTATPVAPGASPNSLDLFYGVKGSQDRTRISAILGIDANPRSSKEREIVRRLEEERVTVAPVA